MRIILADDDEELRFILARMLRKEGYEIEELGDVDTLCQRISQSENPVDSAFHNTVLISDVYMPGGNAIEALANHEAQLRNLPVIFLSSAMDADIYDQGMRLGARAVLSKPIDIDALKLLLKEINLSLYS